MAIIVFEEGPRRGTIFRLPERGSVCIGRDAKCALRLEDSSVAPEHCRIECDPAAYKLVVDEAGHGTEVNDVPAREYVLCDGDRIRVGRVILGFRLPEKDPLVGRSLGGYQLLRRLGRGRESLVYLESSARSIAPWR